MHWLIRNGYNAIFLEMVMAGRCFVPASGSSYAARPWLPWGYLAPVQPPLWPLTSVSAGIHWKVASALLSAAQLSCVLPLPSSGNQVFPEFSTSAIMMSLEKTKMQLRRKADLIQKNLCTHDNDLYFVKKSYKTISKTNTSFFRLFRFGSFEICLGRDGFSGLQGPSAGRHDIRTQLLDYVIETFFPSIQQAHSNRKNRNMAFFREVRRLDVSLRGCKDVGFSIKSLLNMAKTI